MATRNNEQITAYIEGFPESIASILKTTRQILQDAVPDATEDMKYGMPTLRLNGNLIHFAANKAHLGIYPGPEAIVAFQAELQEYATSKGAIQFPYNGKIPYDLIARIAIYQASVMRGLKRR